MPTYIRANDNGGESTTVKKKPLYKIEVSQDTAEIKRVLEVLFKYGYVFNAEYRYKTYMNVCRHYSPSSQSEWEFLRIGHDAECNHVVGHISFWEFQSLKNKYETVTLDKFLEINVGYIKKPEKKERTNLIMTLEEFDEEFLTQCA